MHSDSEIGKLFREKLELHNEEYSDGAWENFVLRRLYKRRIIRRYVTAGVAALLLLGVTVTALLLPQKRIINVPLSANKIEVIKQIPSVVIPEIKDIKTAFLDEKKSQSLISEKTDVDKSVVEKSLSEKVSAIEKEQEEPIIPKEGPAKESLNKKPLLKDFKEDVSVKGNRRKVRFGVNIAPGFSSTSGSQSINISGGINIDIALADGLELSTGLLMEYSDIENQKTAFNDAIPSVHLKTNMTNFDIPVNLTWRFAKTRSESFYVSGGISTLAYLNEKTSRTLYTQELRANKITTSNGEKITTYKLEMIETKIVENPVQNGAMDIAGRVNIILGYSRNISPKLRLHIEPYLKIPVTGIGSRELKFTTSGVTCKISF